MKEMRISSCDFVTVVETAVDDGCTRECLLYVYIM